MKGKIDSKPLDGGIAALRSDSMAKNRSIAETDFDQPHQTNIDCPSPLLVRRLFEMGFSPSASTFPKGGVPLVQLVPWWQLWQREPRRNILVGIGAAVFPAVASGLVALKPEAPIGPSVFAALLPLHDQETAVAQWTDWAIASIHDKSYPGPGPLLGVLEHLLENRPEAERVETWSRLLQSSFDKAGAYPHGPGDHGIALLELVGRSGLRALAPLVSGVLQGKDDEMVLAAIVCLARLGIPDAEQPAEVILNRVRPEKIERARWAVAFVETGDVDLLPGLMRGSGWCQCVQTLRLVEAVLARVGPEGRSRKGWLGSLADLLLAELQEGEDGDIVRCLAVTLGLTLRQSGEEILTKALELAHKLTDKARLESLLNALLIAELPASAAPRVEDLRKQVALVGIQAVRGLNRVLMSLGEPSGTVQDWLDSSVVVFLQMRVLRLPESVQCWFGSPAICPEPIVAAWLTERPDSGLAISFCAAYLAARPSFAQILERIWIGAADGRKPETLTTVGSLLAGAAQDSAISPVELRCCLGHEIAGPLEESPEMLGQLLGLLMTQDKEIAQSAEELLLLTSPQSRAITGCCLRSLKRDGGPFGTKRQRCSRFGAAGALLPHPSTLSYALQSLFVGQTPACCPSERLLEALAMPDKQSKSWARGCVDWEKPEAVKAAFDGTSSTALVATFLQASSSSHGESRQLAGLLAAGVGPRIVETPHCDRVVQRVIFLAAYDPDPNARQAGRKAAEILDIADRVPSTPPPAPEDGCQACGPDLGDPDLDELIRELGRDV